MFFVSVDMNTDDEDHVNSPTIDPADNVEVPPLRVENSSETTEAVVFPATDNPVSNFSPEMSAPKPAESNVLDTELDVESMDDDAFTQKYASAEVSVVFYFWL